MLSRSCAVQWQGADEVEFDSSASTIVDGEGASGQRDDGADSGTGMKSTVCSWTATQCSLACAAQPFRD